MRLVGWILLSGLVAGCQTAYYEAAERFGVFKRDILVSRVETALESQEEAKETFVDALTRFSSVVDVPIGELDSAYRDLADVLETSEERATNVRRRIEAVEDVSRALFDEWESELAAYSSESLRRSSERTLATTRRRYADLIDAMHRAEARIDPVLDAFRDQVLFLKHNLNARAIAALEGNSSVSRAMSPRFCVISTRRSANRANSSWRSPKTSRRTPGRMCARVGEHDVERRVALRAA